MGSTKQDKDTLIGSKQIISYIHYLTGVWIHRNSARRMMKFCILNHVKFHPYSKTSPIVTTKEFVKEWLVRLAVMTTISKESRWSVVRDILSFKNNEPEIKNLEIITKKILSK